MKIWTFAIINAAATTIMGCATDPADSGDDPSARAADQAVTSQCGVVPSGTRLTPGTTVRSCNGRFSLAVTSDGSLVSADGAQRLARIATGFGGYGTYYDGRYATMQADGNFVYTNKICNYGRDLIVRNGAYVCDDTVRFTAFHSSNDEAAARGRSPGIAGSSLHVQDDGQLAIVAPSGEVTWTGLLRL